MGLNIVVSGSFDRTDSFLSRMSSRDIVSNLETYAQAGVNALESATPTETGETAGSWYYEIEGGGLDFIIRWCNRHLDSEGVPIVIMLQLGHGTGTGGYVQGRDFINPAMSGIFDEIANDAWKEVTSA
jgi:hypothetical protein